LTRNEPSDTPAPPTFRRRVIGNLSGVSHGSLPVVPFGQRSGVLKFGIHVAGNQPSLGRRGGARGWGYRRPRTPRLSAPRTLSVREGRPNWGTCTTPVLGTCSSPFGPKGRLGGPCRNARSFCVHTFVPISTTRLGPERGTILGGPAFRSGCDPYPPELKPKAGGESGIRRRLEAWQRSLL